MTPAARTESTRHTRRLLSAMVWNAAQFGAGRAVAFAVTVVLARLLVPEDFGLLALGLLALAAFDRLKDLGVGAGLVQRPGPWERLAPTGLTLTVGGAVLLAGACALLAPGLAGLLGDTDLGPVLRVLAISVAVSGACVVPDSALRRRMLFRQRTAPELTGAAVKGAVSVAMALAGWGVWSLVWGQVAASLTTTVGYWVVYRRSHFARVGFGWDREVARSLSTYGGQLAWVALLALVLDNLDYLFIGNRLGAEQLGYYTMAFRLPELLVISVCAVIGQVLFSSFSALARDPDALRAQFLAVTGAIACLTVPVGVGLSATAPDLVPLVLGHGFGASVRVLELLGLYAAAYSLTFHAGELYKATGKARLLLWLSVVRLVTFAPVLWWAAGRSIAWVAGALLALGAAFGVVRAAVIRRHLALGVAAQLRPVAGPVVAGLLMWVAVVLLGRQLAPDQLPADLLPGGAHLPRLAVLVTAGVAVYVGALVVLDRAALTRLRDLAASLRARA